MGQKIDKLVTHSSIVMNGSKKLMYWLHIPPFQCIVFFNAQSEKKTHSSAWDHCILLVFIYQVTHSSKIELVWCKSSMATHSSVRTILGYTFLRKKFLRLHIPPLKCSSHRNLQMCNHLSIELYTNDYKALCNRMVRPVSRSQTLISIYIVYCPLTKLTLQLQLVH